MNPEERRSHFNSIELTIQTYARSTTSMEGLEPPTLRTGI